MIRHSKVTWLAYNRRVDIILEPDGQKSTEAYPNDIAEARILWQTRVPKLKSVETASKSASGSNLQASNSGN